MAIVPGLEPVPALAIPLWSLTTVALVLALPAARTARSFRRRCAVALVAGWTGAAAIGATLLAPLDGWALSEHTALASAPAGIVALVALPRLGRLRAGAAAFAAAPDAPAAHALRAGAAHPLVVAPLAALAGAAVAGSLIAAGLAVPIGLGALAVWVVAATGLGALRHAALGRQSTHARIAARQWLGAPARVA